MSHIKAVDSKQSTVVMVQVENEIGMLPVAREYGAEANRLFADRVPAELMRHLDASRANQTGLHKLWAEQGGKTDGTWTEVFGEGDAAAEAFTAWHYSRFVEALVVAGKAAYPLPMYVNAALNRMNKAPGEYPSGGPLPHLLDVWKAGAPSLDLLAPDIYFPNFVDLAARFRRADNALFIPEANNADKPEVPGECLLCVRQAGRDRLLAIFHRIHLRPEPQPPGAGLCRAEATQPGNSFRPGARTACPASSRAFSRTKPSSRCR